MGKSTDNMWQSFKGQLVKVHDQRVPVRNKDGKVRELWMTK